MRSNIPSATLWLWWVLTFVGFPVGGGLAYLAARALDGAAGAAIGGVITGLTLVWLVRRPCGSNIDILRYDVLPWKCEDG